MRKIPLILTVVLMLGWGTTAFAAVEHTFHGQFRINGYALSNSEGAYIDPATGLPATEGDVAAQRLRWRPTWDAKLNDDVSVHTQFNIGHIESNASNARTDQSGAPAFGLRHAVLDFKFLGGRVNAGIVPLSDKFGDTLFSGDWDFNPVAYVWLGKLNTVDVRVGTGKLQEKDAAHHDDMDIYLLDVDTAAGAKGKIGGSFYRFINRDTDNNNERNPTLTQNYVGVRFSQDMGVKLNVFALYNMGELKDETGVAPTEKNKGYAIKAEGLLSSGKANFGVMALMASGDKDVGAAGKTSFDSFITPMTLIGHTGYWGYTGKLNIQGTTDTGIDNPLNIDGAAYGRPDGGAGYGIVTLQAKADFPIATKLSGYVAAGYYSHAEAPAGFKKAIGTDIYAEAKYNLAENLNWQLGVDYAMLNKNNAAYGYIKDNNVTLFFSRLQLEY